MSETPKQPNLSSQGTPWKVAVTFNPALGWPILRTQTERMSPTGAVICSDHGNLKGVKVTLILESQPDEDGQTIVQRVEARITSSVVMQQQGQYRHELKFVRSTGDRAVALDQEFAVKPQAQVQTTPPTPPALSHLDKLKALAQQKLAEEQARQQQVEQAARRHPNADTAQPSSKATDESIEKALQQTYEYFKELVEQLNVLKPEFRSLCWDGGRA